MEINPSPGGSTFQGGRDSWVVQRDWPHLFQLTSRLAELKTWPVGRQDRSTLCSFSMFCFKILNEELYWSLTSLYPAKLSEQSLHSLVLFQVLLILGNQANLRHAWALFKSPPASIYTPVPRVSCLDYGLQITAAPSYTTSFPRKRELQDDSSIWHLPTTEAGKRKQLTMKGDIGAHDYFLKLCSCILSNCNLFE